MSQAVLAEFCLRLACGLSCMMVCTSARAVGVQYFRVLMLTVFGLTVLTILFGPGLKGVPGLAVAASAVFAFCGSVYWTLGRATGGRRTAVLLLVSAAVSLLGSGHPTEAAGLTDSLLRAGEAITSTLLLGSMMAAMLLGHSYLVAPATSIEPLNRLVILVGISLAGRAVLAGAALLLASENWGGSSTTWATDGFRWSLFAARWLIGLVAPAIIIWLVWQTARIRSTQSATGILYAGVILTFFGELVGQLLAGSPVLGL